MGKGLMKALLLHGPGEIGVEAVPIPTKGEGSALVKVEAAGICGSDIPRMMRTGAYRHPIIPGHELSGIVVDGEEGLLGKRVSVYPLIPCRKCEWCERGEYQLCENYDYVGSRRDGGFAQFVSVPNWNLVPIPDDISFEEGAMLEPLSVVLHGINRIGPVSGKKVAVIGAGAIGSIAAQICRNMGADAVFVVDIVRYKLRMVEEKGWGIPVDGEKEDPLEVTGGVDIAVEAVGAESTILLALRITRRRGTVLQIGNPHGDLLIPRDLFWKILRWELKILGSWNSRPSEWLEAMELVRRKAVELRPLITHKIRLDDAPDIVKEIYEGRISPQKVMIVF
jgi:L-iditol 2-dehydrogenase